MMERNSAPGARAVTPSDTDGYDRIARAFYVGATGDVALVTSEGNTVTFTAVPVGAIIPIMHTRINSTNTTASNIVALF